ncbi:triosephosphate isomerase [Mycoplasma haemofelis str. Langford 1]|uniref:Triosephosphate isomerase n=2 Tax=Mycoplasma haemofelis TaxID=29501 RepID=F6FHQ9_MYCHI|nr:triose-phosphate isomerase [Mycoplasma haemofelis]AEG73823.1 triosephosphate isomerase [Mycoplasma haemofelis Ohio2]CBY93530.1 triosephosphate isomerase [Mycoplasma haemofelis str. Langford 1]
MKIVFGNLKMNFLYKDFQDYIENLRMKFLGETPKVHLGLAIPYIYLKSASESIGSKIKVLAQDLHPVDFGAFTSSVSAAQLASLNVPATLIGHSECRQLSQNSFVISNKIKSALRNGLEIIYCCGEDPEKEISEELFFMTEEEISKVIIAYEPISSIGTGQAMDPSGADSTLLKIRDLIADKYGRKVADSMKLLYGGSVNLSNYKGYLEKKNIDGVLVGGASLKVDDLWKMATLE